MSGARKTKAVCEVCGKPVEKPRRGPTPRFCGERCRKIARRARRAARDAELDRDADRAVAGLEAQAGRLRAMAERLDHGIDQRAPARAREDLRLCLMRQAKIIVDGGPDLIGGARDGGYAGELLARIDRLGNPGDAERLLRHNGYDGPVPGKPVPEGGRPARNGPDNRTETAETPVFG